MIDAHKKKLRLAILALRRAEIGSCRCITKSPEAKYHTDWCNYKSIAEAIALIKEVIAEGTSAPQS